MIRPKAEIVRELRRSFDLLIKAGNAVPEEIFNTPIENKWTPAENLQHLLTSAKMTRMAFALPKVIHWVVYGSSHRSSKGYNKLVANYKKKLNNGGQASGVYVPKKTNYNKAEVIKKLATAGEALCKTIDKGWNPDQLENYAVPHPLLGMLTMRELAYFTIYHNHHHLQTITKYYLPQPAQPVLAPFDTEEE